MRASEEQRRELMGQDEDNPMLEKSDLPALWISGLLTIGIPCLLLILLIVGVTYLIFFH